MTENARFHRKAAFLQVHHPVQKQNALQNSAMTPTGRNKRSGFYSACRHQMGTQLLIDPKTIRYVPPNAPARCVPAPVAIRRWDFVIWPEILVSGLKICLQTHMPPRPTEVKRFKESSDTARFPGWSLSNTTDSKICFGVHKLFAFFSSGQWF
ncbi:MAG: hypothetical protein JXX14_00845 [Deltaproteobacteria bacterium]|nr:hypothetical protein [Deltaproteobacteria bacterium]